MTDTLNAELRYIFIFVLLGKLATLRTIYIYIYFFFFTFNASRLTGNLSRSDKMPGLYTVKCFTGLHFSTVLCIL